jgi:hypothetical protein
MKKLEIQLRQTYHQPAKLAPFDPKYKAGLFFAGLPLRKLCRTRRRELPLRFFVQK